MEMGDYGHSRRGCAARERTQFVFVRGDARPFEQRKWHSSVRIKLNAIRPPPLALIDKERSTAIVV
jgi:hypothetical protein